MCNVSHSQFGVTSMQIFLIPRFLSTPRVASWITCSSKILLLTYRFCIDEQVKHFIIIIIIFFTLGRYVPEGV